MCYSEEFWKAWWSNRTSPVNFNVVDTDQYDIIDGKAVERKEYKRKQLEDERKRLQALTEVYNKALVENLQRIQSIGEELEELE